MAAPMLRWLVVALVAGVLASSGCAVRSARNSPSDGETEIFLRQANFETAVVQARGSASCDYILFMIPLCANQDIATVAWQRMYQRAGVEGRPAQFVNVVVDGLRRWSVLGLYWREEYTVSADVIAYR